VENRNLYGEKKEFAFYVVGVVFYFAIIVTLAYAYFAKIIFGTGYYVSVLFAGIIGGIWGLVFSKAFDFYYNLVSAENEKWLLKYPDYQSFLGSLQKEKKRIKIAFIILVIEALLVYFLG